MKKLVPPLSAASVGLLVVVFALMVQAPRLAYSFILADGLTIAPTAEYWGLVITGMALSICLTLGNAYLVHILAKRFRADSWLSWILLGAFCLYMAFAVVLVAPAIVVGMQNSPIARVLGGETTSTIVWAWAIIAALSVEILVAGSMAAYALEKRSMPTPRPATVENDTPNTLKPSAPRPKATAPAPVAPAPASFVLPATATNGHLDIHTVVAGKPNVSASEVAALFGLKAASSGKKLLNEAGYTYNPTRKEWERGPLPQAA